MTTDRRTFLRNSAFAAATVAAPAVVRAAAPKKYIWANLLQLGCNMWNDHVAEPDKPYENTVADFLRFDENVWKDLTEHMRDIGMNMVVIDLAEGLVYPSHPELAVKGSWMPETLRAELVRLRKMGLEPIPKLNFSASHDGWLGPWRYCRCTEKYYRVCREVIREVYDIFEKPRFFHIGMDEEDMAHQGKRELVCFRRGELWWHDFLGFVKDVEDCGARAWMWSDFGWNHGEEFVKHCPKSVVQSNWYYDEGPYGFDPAKPTKDKWDKTWQNALNLFVDLDKAGFDQIPCGSIWNSPQREKLGIKTNDSMTELMAFCRKNVSPERLKGFLMASWADYQVPSTKKDNEHAMDLVAQG